MRNLRPRRRLSQKPMPLFQRQTIHLPPPISPPRRESQPPPTLPRQSQQKLSQPSREMSRQISTVQKLLPEGLLSEGVAQGSSTQPLLRRMLLLMRSSAAKSRVMTSPQLRAQLCRVRHEGRLRLRIQKIQCSCSLQLPVPTRKSRMPERRLMIRCCTAY